MSDSGLPDPGKACQASPRLIELQLGLAIALANSHDPDEILRLCLDAAIEVSGMDSGGVYLKEAGTGDLRLRAHKGLAETFAASASLIPASSPKAMLIETGPPLYGRYSELIQPLGEAEKNERLEAIAVVPVRHRDHVVGCVNVASHTIAEVPRAVRGALETVVWQVGGALARAEAERVSRGLAQIIHQCPYPIVSTDLDGRITSWNDGAERSFGYSAAEVVGREVSLMYPAGAGLPLQEGFIEPLLRGGRHELEVLNRRRDGTEFTAQLTLWMLRDEHGQPTAMVGYGLDISKRKRLEELMQARLRLLQMPDTSSLTVVHESVVREAKALTRSRDGFFRVLDGGWFSGHEGASFQMQDHGTASVDGTPLPDGPLVAECLVARKPVFRHEIKRVGLQPTDSSPVSASEESLLVVPLVRGSTAFAVLGVRGKPGEYDQSDVEALTVLGKIGWDVIERLCAEKALRDSEEHLRLATEAAQIGIWERDLGTDRLSYSPLMERLLGYEPGSFPGTEAAFGALLHPESTDAYATARAQARTGEGFFQTELRFKLRDGGDRWALVLGRRLVDTEGRPTRIVGVHIDITERKCLEERYRHSQKLESIGQLAGGVAHDFNNILAAMLMQLALLSRGPDVPDEIRRSMHDLELEARRAANLTRQLLMFSRRSVLQMRPRDLNEVVANLLPMLGRLLGEHIDLSFQRKADLPSVEIDEGMIEQVLVNLAVNARDAMPKGGQITISSDLVEILAGDLGANHEMRPGTFVRLSVADTGSGMDEATRKRVFEPFFTTKEPGRGTGLGLATVYGIVAQHRGWVEAESELGRGTTFRILLPGCAQPVVAHNEKPPGVLARGKETLLVVEDELMVRRLLAQFLRRLGYTVIEASNGREAIGLWAEHGRVVDLLFTDMVMPEGLTGLELADRLRAEKPGLKVIVASGYSSDMLQSGVAKRSRAVYLAKPFEAPALAAAVRACLDAS